MNKYQCNSQGKATSKAAGVLEVNEVNTLAAQVEALSKKIDRLLLPKPVTVMAFQTYGDKHMVIDCLIVGAP